jgi:hypothetical protein
VADDAIVAPKIRPHIDPCRAARFAVATSTARSARASP